MFRRTTPATAHDRAYIEINLENLRHNAAVLQNALPKGCELMAVVKANAYGHDAPKICACLSKSGVRAFAVATLDEGVRLRKCGIRGTILILGFTDVSRAPALKHYDLTQTLIDYAYADALNRQGISVKAHLKVDTGMHRLGIDCTNPAQAAAIFSMRHLHITGIYTHLCCADSLQPDAVSFTRTQIARFYRLTDSLKENGVEIPKIHLQSSYGLLNYPDLSCDYVRAGICLYGVFSSPGEQTGLQLHLRPVLSLRSSIILIREIKAGESVGYGRAYVAACDRRIAIVPIGYADGYPRALSRNAGYVLVNGSIAPIVGNICMDQLAIDITEIPGVCTGSCVTLIGRDGDREILAADLAQNAGSITNELLSRLGKRLQPSNNCQPFFQKNILRFAQLLLR